MPDSQSSTAVTSKKPSSSNFKQQRLKAWQPVLSAGSVLPLLFVLGIAFTPIGIALYSMNENLFEKTQEYTDCTSIADPRQSCHSVVSNWSKRTSALMELALHQEPCICNITIEIPENLEGVYFYYELNNFYQNHRRYVKSRDDRQLVGIDIYEPSDDCAPFQYSKIARTLGRSSKSSGVPLGPPIAPCGAIANSFFNDTFRIFYNGQEELNLTRTGIAWPTDKSRKFHNPDNLTAYAARFKKPVNWNHTIAEMDPSDPTNNGYYNEDFIVWMRTAAFAKFRKLHRIIGNLRSGNLTIQVNYAFPVKQFSGTKSIVFSQVNFLGGKNKWLALIYAGTGVLCLLLGIIFLILHIKYGKMQFQVMDVQSS